MTLAAPAADQDGDAGRLAATAAEQTDGPPAAAGSSFYTAMRILPRARREAMYAIYAFCRAVDDIADDGGPRDERRAALDRWRATVDRLFSGRSATPAWLAAPIRRFGLLREDFLAVIDGMAMDVEADICAPDWATLDLYVDRVASAVGRLSVRAFGMAEPAGSDLSHHLGRALQLTNILRDLDEDAAIGRLYLPREALEEAGIDPRATPAAILADPQLEAACEAVAARAAGHFAAAGRIMAAAPRRAVKAPRLMGVAYADILKRLRARGWAAPRTPVRLSKPRLILAALRYGIL